MDGRQTAVAAHSVATRSITLRGLRVHNLQNVDLDLPLGRLTVLTGVSGAGKSSLAFDGLYAESQRRYVQSFSAYSRQFLEQFEPPDADSIGFLPPAIAIRRSTPSPRATVGTLTELAHDLRVAFSRHGHVVCPDCQVEVRPATPQSVVEEISALPAGTRIQLAFEWEGTEEVLRQAGFARAIIAGKTIELRAEGESQPRPKKRDRPQAAWVVVDRVTAGRTEPSRLLESLETAFAHGGGEAILLAATSPAGQVSNLSEPTSPPAATQTIDGQSWHVLHRSIDHRCPSCRRTFPRPEPALFAYDTALGGCPKCSGTGLVGGRVKEVCPDCRGTRLQPEALAVQVEGRTFAEWSALSVSELRQCRLPGETRRFQQRLEWIEDVALGHLTLDRPANTLSAGESRRLQLVAALGTRLVNTLCLIDEPTAGMHPTEVPRVLSVLRALRDTGNTLVVIEHDPAVIAAADCVVEIGPGAGPDGGRVVSISTLPIAQPATEPLVSPERQAEPERRVATGWLTLSGVTFRNLRNQTVRFPLGVLCVVTGPSGSGKSTLVCDVLHPAVVAQLAKQPPPWGELSKAEGFDNVVLIDRRPLPRTVRSSPGSVLGILALIRKLFAATPDAQARNYGPLHFSFNASAGGRCPACQGLGEMRVDLQFLPDVRTVCPECLGTRFRREVLDVRYRGLSIAEILAMNARDAFPFFRGLPQLQKRLKLLKDVGLDYLPLGRSAATLSNGEMQRLKLAASLRRGRQRTLFLMDEPSTGLHPKDVTRLLHVFDQLLTASHSLVVIDNKPAVVRAADHLIEMRPSGEPQ